MSEKLRLVEMPPLPSGEACFHYEEVSCSRCFFYSPEGDQDTQFPRGECRRWAPKPYLSQGDATEAPVVIEWPVVFGGEWCGEFKPEKEGF